MTTRKGMTVAERKGRRTVVITPQDACNCMQWDPAERLRDVDVLTQTWGFGDRAEAVDVAVRFLLKHSDSMSTLEL